MLVWKLIPVSKRGPIRQEKSSNNSNHYLLMETAKNLDDFIFKIIFPIENILIQL